MSESLLAPAPVDVDIAPVALNVDIAPVALNVDIAPVALQVNKARGGFAFPPVPVDFEYTVPLALKPNYKSIVANTPLDMFEPDHHDIAYNPEFPSIEDTLTTKKNKTEQSGTKNRKMRATTSMKQCVFCVAFGCNGDETCKGRCQREICKYSPSHSKNSCTEKCKYCGNKWHPENMCRFLCRIPECCEGKETHMFNKEVCAHFCTCCIKKGHTVTECFHKCGNLKCRTKPVHHYTKCHFFNKK
jgi:hypothetical protein